MTEDLVCGLHSVLTALSEHPDRIDAIWVSTERVDRRIEEVLAAARAHGVKFHRVPRTKLDSMAEGARHQGVLARLHIKPLGNEHGLADFLTRLPRAPLFLVLDGVQDPHNLGACLRVADGAGVHAVILPRDRSAPISAATRRAASGAAETVQIFQVTNLARSLDQLKDAGVWLYGTAQDGTEDLYDTELTGSVALVFGGEGEGMRRLTRERCDRLVRIPMTGKVGSLNVSVAAAVALYEAMRQRRMQQA